MNPVRWEKEIWPFLPPELRNVLRSAVEKTAGNILEIRLRLKRPLAIETDHGTFFAAGDGSCSLLAENGLIIERATLDKVFHLISQNSVYAFEEELRQGYITIPGGHRIGFVGKAVLEEGRLKCLRALSGYNFRICRQLKGIAQKIIRYLIIPPRKVFHTLIMSGPGMGKTTLLRDIVRLISNGIPELNFDGVNVGVADERSELAGSYLGEPQLDLGIRSDILDGCPKSIGMLLLARSMGPQVIATDELGGERDLDALETVINAGVSVITTVHAGSTAELAGKPGWNKFLQRPVFERIIVMKRRDGMFFADVSDGIKGNRLHTCPMMAGRAGRWGYGGPDDFRPAEQI